MSVSPPLLFLHLSFLNPLFSVRSGFSLCMGYSVSVYALPFCKLSLSLYKHSLSLYDFSLSLYKLSLSLEFWAHDVKKVADR